MAYVSKKPLKRDVRKHLDSQLVKSIISLRSMGTGGKFLSELFTETEQIMLAKRLMMVFMLTEGVSQYRIKQVLKVSSSTVLRLARDVDRGDYEHVSRFCRQKSNREVLWKELEVLVRFGMPSMGRDRWDWLNKMYK